MRFKHGFGIFLGQKMLKKAFFELFGHSSQFFFYILRAGVRDCSVARLLDFSGYFGLIWLFASDMSNNNRIEPETRL